MLDKQDLQIFKVASKDKSRPILTGAKFSKVKHNAGWGIKMAATDGYRVTEKIKEVDYEPAFKDMIIPASTLEAVSKLLDRSHKLLLSDTQFKIMSVRQTPEGILDRTVTIGETLTGHFPDYEQLIPLQEPKAAVHVNVKYLIEALKQSGKESVVLELHGENSPVVLRDKTDEGAILSLVMPLKS